jgi:mono/diheme cytochrome c family protein
MNRQQLSLSLATVVGIALTGALGAQPPASATGNVTRGAQLFSDTYNCYACHGFDAQSGERRLVPMNYTQDGFVTFVQNSPLPNMPAFPDAAAQDLVDIYAYIRTIPADAPTLDQAGLLRDILERKNAAAGK